MSYRIGIDVGGTFTDFLLIRGDGSVCLRKTPTTPRDQSVGVMAGLGELARDEGTDLRGLLGATDIVVHGTTTADNTMIEMNGAVTGLLTTEGHRDEIDIRRGYKEDIWDPAAPPPVPIAPRRRRFGIPERLDFRGEVVTPLDEEAVRAACRRLARQGVESVAICLLFSFVNPAHERRVAEICREELPDARLSVSHEIMPTAPEFERTSTTLVDAYVGPRLERYLSRLEGALREAGYARELLLMQSNGGIMTAGFLARKAVAALGSGPTGGAMGACAVAGEAGVSDFIAVDMGGTSYEACLVKGGRPTIRSFWNWQHRYLVGLPMVEMHSIGAGGGSIASVQAGALKVGPRSAGADPGPICYGRGGTEPTVTDANWLLGYINPQALCGGDFKLSAEGVREAIGEKVGRPLGLDAVEAAWGIFRIVNANMANAIRRVSCEAGHDPRAFAMVVYGGNGPVHAGRQAEDLGIRSVLVPRTSPAFSALGLVIADYAVDIKRSCIAPAARAEPERVNALLDELEAEALRDLAVAGLGPGDVAFQRFLAVCYPGQTFDLAVPAVLDGAGRMGRRELAATIEASTTSTRRPTPTPPGTRSPSCAPCACRPWAAPRSPRCGAGSAPGSPSRRPCAAAGRRTSARATWTRRSTTATHSATATASRARPSWRSASRPSSCSPATWPRWTTSATTGSPSPDEPRSPMPRASRPIDSDCPLYGLPQALFVERER